MSCYYNRVLNTCPSYTYVTPILQCKVVSGQYTYTILPVFGYRIKLCDLFTLFTKILYNFNKTLQNYNNDKLTWNKILRTLPQYLGLVCNLITTVEHESRADTGYFGHSLFINLIFILHQILNAGHRYGLYTAYTTLSYLTYS